MREFGAKFERRRLSQLAACAQWSPGSRRQPIELTSACDVANGFVNETQRNAETAWNAP
jgi:hypothetical protein